MVTDLIHRSKERVFKERFHFKLILSYFLVVLISFGVVAFFLDRSLEKNSFQDIKASLVNQTILIQNQMSSEQLIRSNTVDLMAFVRSIGSKINARITIVSSKGKVLADSQRSPDEVLRMENHADRREIRAALSGQVGEDTHYSNTLKKNMLYVALPVQDQGSIVGALRLAIPLTSVDKTLWTVREIVIMGMILAVFLAFGLGWIVSAKTIQPIKRMIQVSRKFAEGDFSRAIPQDSRDEIGELAATLNKMANDLESKIYEIQTQNQHLEAIFSSMIEGVIVVNGSGQVISINSAVEKIFAITHKQGERCPLLEIIRNNDIFEIMNKALITGNVFSKDLSLNYPVKKIFRISASPVFEKGVVSGCLVVIHDITEIRRLETMRRDFVANVSHELKTPLTSIKGYVEALLDGALEDKEHSRQFLKIVSEHAERLGQLINDLLDLSAIESQEVALNMTTFDLKGLVQKVLSNFQTQIGKQGLNIIDELSKDLMITADRARMEQVLTNLIDNAIKFNKPGGSIKFSGRKIENKIEIVVEDSGIGIPATDVPRIFERFYRVDKARSRELGGTGLGLSIVKHIIEQHHGIVEVESSVGFGSRFLFTIPV